MLLEAIKKGIHSSSSHIRAVDINQDIIRRQREAEMKRHSVTDQVKPTTLTKEFFEGLKIA